MRHTILAIDPGNLESAYALIDADTLRPVRADKIPNEGLLMLLNCHPHVSTADAVAIEMVASYGMPVGAEVFETCVWIGRFQQQVLGAGIAKPALVKRQPVKVHHCHSAKAKDSNVIQALVDRFAAGQPNRGKGTKADPGWFHGFAADMWQAYALAVFVADARKGLAA